MRPRTATATTPGKPALYRVADSSLRFYLGVGRTAHNLSKRGRSEAAAALIRRRWATWRGRAVEPIIRDALSRAAPDLPWPEAEAVGGWWNRAFDPEVDLIGASATGCSDSAADGLALCWLPADIVAAFA